MNVIETMGATLVISVNEHAAQIVETAAPAVVIETPAAQGPEGRPAYASASADAGNIITVGTDGLLYAPAPQLSSAQW